MRGMRWKGMIWRGMREKQNLETPYEEWRRNLKMLQCWKLGLYNSWNPWNVGIVKRCSSYKEYIADSSTQSHTAVQFHNYVTVEPLLCLCNMISWLKKLRQRNRVKVNVNQLKLSWQLHCPGWMQIFNGLFDWRCCWFWPWRCFRFIAQGFIVLINRLWLRLWHPFPEDQINWIQYKLGKQYSYI